MSNKNKLPEQDLSASYIWIPPNAPQVYNSDGSLNWMPNSSGTSTWTNPLGILTRTYQANTINLIGNVNISYQLSKNLDLKNSFGYTSNFSDELNLSPSTGRRPDDFSICLLPITDIKNLVVGY